MPQLLVFAPCEKVIISGEETGDGSTSLITILQGVTAEIPEKSIEDAVAPTSWFIFTLWKSLAEDEGKSFEQSAELFSPSGKALMITKSSFTVTKPFQRSTSKIVGMPVGEVGDYRIVLSLTEAGKPESKREITTYPIAVAHKIVPSIEGVVA